MCSAFLSVWNRISDSWDFNFAIFQKSSGFNYSIGEFEFLLNTLYSMTEEGLFMAVTLYQITKNWY